MFILERFGIKDLVDILLVGYILYSLYKLMRSSGSNSIFSGILSFVLLWFVVEYVLEMRLLGALFDKVASVGPIVLVILFQDEIRRFLINLGTHRRWKTIKKYFKSETKEEIGSIEVLPIVKACLNMSKRKIGALIVMEGENPLDHYVKSSEPVDAKISSLLIENIFFKNSPMHDGAMVISNGRIKTAGGYLPFPHRTDIPQRFGARHRSAIGISETTDARVIVVSEESGSISLAYRGRLFFNLSAERLEQMLIEETIDMGGSL